jgi:hypothetical protein
MWQRLVLAALLAIWLLTPEISSAREPGGESVSPKGGVENAERAAEQSSRADEEIEPAAEGPAKEPGRFDSPSWVMFRSLLIPGWGQAKNGAWAKAVLVAGLEITFFNQLISERRSVDDYERKAEEDPDNADEYLAAADRHRERFRDWVWWTGLLILLSMGDAYVDAHLKDFDVRLQAEPQIEEANEGNQGTDIGMRVSLGVRF